MRRIYPYFTLILVIFLSTLLVWTPFITKSSNWLGLKIENSSFDYIYRHYDGPLYIIPAKTFYDPAKFLSKDGANIIGISPGYFAAHLPFYPLLIRGVRELIQLTGLTSLPAGRQVNGLEYLKSMVIVNLLATVGLACLFYFILKKFKITKNPWLLTVIMFFLPRFLVIRSVGAPESLFMLLTLGSLYFFEKEKYWLAGLLGGLSVATKSPGILLFCAYCLTIVERIIRTKKINWRWLGIILIPFGLLTVFFVYWLKLGDFFAYFHSGDNVHLIYPFSVFNFQKPWIGTAWLEDVIFYFVLYGLTVISLKDFKYRS